MDQMSPFVFYIIVGAALISAELLIFNLSVFWFLFIGLGAIIAGASAWIFPEAGWLYTTLIFVVASATVSVALYPPLKKWQAKPSAMPGNDAIGKEVDIIEAVTKEKAGKAEWSGATWDAKLASNSEDIAIGESAVITSINGIKLTVTKAD